MKKRYDLLILLILYYFFFFAMIITAIWTLVSFLTFLIKDYSFDWYSINSFFINVMLTIFFRVLFLLKHEKAMNEIKSREEKMKNSTSKFQQKLNEMYFNQKNKK